jgi:hypothetical protein
MMSCRLALPVMGALCLLATSTQASVVTAPSFEALVASAGDIFLGQVTARTSRIETRGVKRLVVTDVTFRTEEVLKGERAALKTLTFLGGQVGDVRMDVPGIPTFMVGDRDVLFLQRRRSTLMPIVGMFHGRFRVVTGPGGAGLFVANNSRQPIDAVVTYATPSRALAAARPLALSDFLNTIRTMAAGR